MITSQIGYDGKSFLNGINISIRENQFLGVLGANGGGKTTFIKTVMGLIPQIDGEIKRKNKVVFGYVPQHEKFDPIFPASVVEIVTMGRYSRVSFGKRINKIDKDIVEESMDKVGISKIKNSVFSFSFWRRKATCTNSASIIKRARFANIR